MHSPDHGRSKAGFWRVKYISAMKEDSNKEYHGQKPENEVVGGLQIKGLADF